MPKSVDRLSVGDAKIPLDDGRFDNVYMLFFQSKPICGLNQLVCDCRLVGAVVLCLGSGSLVVDSLFIVLLVFVVVDFVVVLVL